MAEPRDAIDSVTNIDHLVTNTSCRKLLKTIHSLVFSLKGRAWQEPEPSHVTGMALAHCVLGTRSWE